MASVVERRIRDRKVSGSSPGGASVASFFLQGPLSVLALIPVSVPRPCYPSST